MPFVQSFSEAGQAKIREVSELLQAMKSIGQQITTIWEQIECSEDSDKTNPLNQSFPFDFSIDEFESMVEVWRSAMTNPLSSISLNGISMLDRQTEESNVFAFAPGELNGDMMADLTMKVLSALNMDRRQGFWKIIGSTAEHYTNYSRQSIECAILVRFGGVQ